LYNNYCNCHTYIYEFRKVKRLFFNFINILLYECLNRLSNIGRLPVCNQKPSRAPKIMNFSFPLCWRCLSICFSIILGLKIISFNVNYRLNILYAIILLIPCLIDGILQYYFYIESTNFRRVVTGIFAGLGIAILIEYIRYYQIFKCVLTIP